MRFGDKKNRNPGRVLYRVRPIDATERDHVCAHNGCPVRARVHVQQEDVRTPLWPAQFVCCWNHLLDFLRDARVAADAEAPRS